MRIVALAVVVAARSAAADPPQVQADLGLAVIGLAYEQPVATQVSVQVEVQAFSTYFLPWFSRGASVRGFGGELRPTWFSREHRHGLYVAPYLRVDRIGDGSTGYCAGGFAGWAFAVTPTLDVRIGGGAQYLHYTGVATPFVALDLVVGYAL